MRRHVKGPAGEYYPKAWRFSRGVHLALYRPSTHGNTFASINGLRNTGQYRRDRSQGHPPGIDGDSARHSRGNQGKGGLHAETGADHIVDKERRHAGRKVSAQAKAKTYNSCKDCRILDSEREPV